METDPSTMRAGGPATIADIIDRILDKGLVINADIAVSLAGVELLSIRIRAVLASLDAAARYGLQLPAGSNLDTDAWKQAVLVKEDCPQCSKRSTVESLLSDGCPWCGWVSARAGKLAASA
ncbi:MAG: gas vesicle protein [Planctomycetota bacterium]|nr:gas vesicle protein [Planctomycetota bacterium]